MKSIIIDFFGLPGSGKSTCSHEIASLLRNKGYRVIEPSYNLDHSFAPITRRMKKVCLTAIFSLFYPYKFISIVRLVGKYSFSPNGFMSNVIDITCKLLFCELYYEKYEYIVFDEGLLQAAISLSFYKPNSILNMYKKINQIGDHADIEIRTVFVNCSPYEALKRIKIRNTNDTSLERLNDDNEKMDYLLSFQRIVETVLNDWSNEVLVQSYDDYLIEILL